MKIPHEFSRPVRIGSGSFSTVYRAFQYKLERSVVLKILPLAKVKDSDDVEREAHILASMRLPCVPHIYDVVRMRKKIIIVMEWIRGIPLSTLAEQTLTVECKFALASAIIGGLAILHNNNIAHCDLKPENILITSDLRVFFVDFGFSRLHSIISHSPGLIQGTPAFMAPELWSSPDKIDYKKVDLYALGILLHGLLGNIMPSFAAELTSSDPRLRPHDCASFEKIWHANYPHLEETQLPCLHIAAAVKEYIARMLLSGARELQGIGRSEEAYALLTESLDIWPDYTEALDYLQTKFSTPIKTTGRKRKLLAAAVSCAIALVVWVAYFIGTQSSISRDIISNVSIKNEETPLASLSTSFGNNRPSQALPVILRGIESGMNLTGTITVIGFSEKGALFVDGTTFTGRQDKSTSILLKAGTHRIEWLDSTTQRRVGETVEVLPFEKKTVSLKRFFNGKQS